MGTRGKSAGQSLLPTRFLKSTPASLSFRAVVRSSRFPRQPISRHGGNRERISTGTPVLKGNMESMILAKKERCHESCRLDPAVSIAAG